MTLSDPPPGPYTAVLADDHEVTREGLGAMLLSLGNISILGHASNGKEAIDLVEEVDPDFLFVDVEMPILSGIEVARRVSSTNERIRIIALSAYDYREYVYGLLRCGASAYLKKSEANRENLAAAIATIAADRNEHWISPDLAKRLVLRNVSANSMDEPLAGLTPREIEMLRYVAKGRSNEEIKDDLSLSVHTVKNHIDHIRSKLDVGTRAELVAWAWQNKIVTP